MSITGTVFLVDLTRGEIRKETISEEVYRKYPGGSALAGYLLWQHCPAGADPLSPDNVLVMAVSPLTGLAISGQSRMTAAARSPLTGGFGDSQCGGFFPAEMKAAGADAIVFLGRAIAPVYFALRDGAAELRPAGHLWGKVTADVDREIKHELGDPKLEVAQIGPAGENLVRFAAIMNMANRANGRTGLGAVMGSKNLKAVAVRGTELPRAAEPDRFRELVRRFKELETATGIAHFGKYGTAGVVASQNYKGGLPTHNYNAGHFAGANRITGERLHDDFMIDRDTCFACGIRCKRVVEVPASVDPAYGGPEYETIATFGSYCGVDDLGAICKANEICNKYGMDTISCGATIAFALECGEKGLLQDESLRFGRADTVLRLAEEIALRRPGLGEMLAEGSARAAAALGPAAEGLTVTVKGQEAPAHMPQVKRSLGLIYAVNPFGADHQSSEHDTALLAKPGTIFRQRLEELGFADALPPKDLSDAKVRFAYRSQLFYSAMDTYNLCQFVFGPSWQLYGPHDAVELVRAATGWDVTLDELLQVGERRLNLMRAFNAREGLGRSADTLPKKMFKPLTGGPSDGVALSHEEMERALVLYYDLAGWDQSTGVPTPGRLAALGLEWIQLG
ncbi:MAG TPA: aldehyde ferredoxin oxidoreductase family protein [Symbiobacteriaceae bacterium]|nr:aldehyde ferredoxin oxidoreductase family protein [Symbiobacteriaceae bacterium]